MTENEMRGVNTILEGALCAAELSTRPRTKNPSMLVVKYAAPRND
jgi:hypothetical protein